MDNQYCKVGTVTPITSGQQAVAILENRYRNFLQKASDLNESDKRLVEFFENKAQNIKKVLEDLVQ
jgi:type III secretory pathway component EscR